MRISVENDFASHVIFCGYLLFARNVYTVVPEFLCDTVENINTQFTVSLSLSVSVSVSLTMPLSDSPVPVLVLIRLKRPS
jgi:hypothetical protein